MAVDWHKIADVARCSLSQNKTKQKGNEGMDSSWVLHTHLVFGLEGSQKPLLTVQAVGLWGC